MELWWQVEWTGDWHPVEGLGAQGTCGREQECANRQY